MGSLIFLNQQILWSQNGMLHLDLHLADEKEGPCNICQPGKSPGPDGLLPKQHVAEILRR